MTSIAFTVPGPVRGKGRPRTRVVGNHAMIYTDGKTRNYEGEVKAVAARAMGDAPLLLGPLGVDMIIRFLPPESTSKAKVRRMLAGLDRPTKKPDADNVLKVMDALNGVVFRDDAQVCTVRLQKVYAATPGLDVLIFTLDLSAPREAI